MVDDFTRKGVVEVVKVGLRLRGSEGGPERRSRICP